MLHKNSIYTKILKFLVNLMNKNAYLAKVEGESQILAGYYLCFHSCSLFFPTHSLALIFLNNFLDEKQENSSGCGFIYILIRTHRPHPSTPPTNIQMVIIGMHPPPEPGKEPRWFFHLLSLVHLCRVPPAARQVWYGCCTQRWNSINTCSNNGYMVASSLLQH